MTWTTTWPTAPGAHWFYGKAYPQERRARVRLVTVSPSLDGLTYATDGIALHETEYCHGWWKDAYVPSPPVSEVVPKRIR